MEEQYLLAISDACPLGKWKQIVDRAVQDALNGDSPARDWLAKYLVGKPHDRHLDSLVSLVAQEQLGHTIDNKIEHEAVFV